MWEINYRKIMARMKVNAGLTLLMAEDKVGELYLIPLYPAICAALLFYSQKKLKNKHKNKSKNTSLH